MDHYHQDYSLWLQSQVKLLRTGRFHELDVEHLIEEMVDMGASSRRALASHLIILLAHLLKWQFQPEHRCSSWSGSIVEQRVQIEDLLDASPSLGSLIPELMAHTYPKALKIASKETGIPYSGFPSASPYTLDQILDEDYFP